jgi:NAD(P)-dependent dehydrogenase (short-subunit alcohol dehydrogenase family)
MGVLTGKRVVVTGASKGIGAAIAGAMLDAGAQVVAHFGTDRAGAEAAVAGAPDRAELIAADMGDTRAVDAFWAEVVAATKTVARTHAKDGILAYVISPGVVATQMSVESAARTGGVAAITAGLPMGEWVPPEEIAALAVFLAEGRARHLTGTTIDINGAAYIR